MCFLHCISCNLNTISIYWFSPLTPYCNYPHTILYAAYRYHNLTVLRKAVKRRSFAILGVLNTHYKNENSRPDTTEREHSFKGICSETPIARNFMKSSVSFMLISVLSSTWQNVWRFSADPFSRCISIFWFEIVITSSCFLSSYKESPPRIAKPFRKLLDWIK